MQRHVCYRCSYDVRGLAAGTCPECGTELSRGAYKRFLAHGTRLDAILLRTMVVTGLGAGPIAILADLLPGPDVSGVVLVSTLSLVAAVASCWYFIRVLSRKGASWASAFGVIPGLLTWAAMMCVSLWIAYALAGAGISLR
jgi:hypothetical protein